MKKKSLNCFCCGAEITAPQYFNGKAYGYTCITKVSGQKRVSKKEMCAIEFTRMYQSTVNDGSVHSRLPLATIMVENKPVNVRVNGFYLASSGLVTGDLEFRSGLFIDFENFIIYAPRLFFKGLGMRKILCKISENEWLDSLAV